MKTLIKLAACLVIFFQTVLTVDKKGPLELTTDNFDKIIGNKPAFIKFYAPWCGHCRTLAPVFDKLANAYSQFADNVIVAKGFPTLLWFPQGISSKPEKYSGGRDINSLSSFLSKKTGLKPFIKGDVKYTVTLTNGNFNKIVKDPKKAVMVEFYNEHCFACSKFEQTYQKIAKIYEASDDIIIAQAKIDDNKAVITEKDSVEYNNKPIVKFYPKGTDKIPIDVQEEAYQFEDLIEVINKHSEKKRQTNGHLDENAGVQLDLDSHIVSFLQAHEQNRESELNKIKEGHKKDANMSFYVRVLEKLDEKGTEFLVDEAKRIKKLISDDENTSTAKIDELTVRLNILKHIAKHAGITLEQNEEEEEKADEQLASEL